MVLLQVGRVQALQAGKLANLVIPWKNSNKTIFMTLGKAGHILAELTALGEVVRKSWNISVYWLLFFMTFNRLLKKDTRDGKE